MSVVTVTREIRHAHFFCGLGGGARGFNQGQARLGNTVAKFRCIGGVDSDPAAVKDFTRLAGVQGTLLDLFSRDQYAAFHGQEPPAGWREATIEDVRLAFGNEVPNILFLSPPCKGFSGLLSEVRSLSPKYQALNQLTLRGLFLALEAWRDDLPEFVLLENVPRIQNRGRALLEQIIPLLQSYGYATAETTHDCGELGNLAQSRKRFLLVARNVAKVRPFLYEPKKRPLRAVGDVLGRLPLPGLEEAGPMHRLPALQWKTWVRLAFVEAGSDWRSLQKLRVVDGHLADFAIAPSGYGGYLGVCRWREAMGTVAGQSLPTNGKFAVADPRVAQSAEYQQLGVRRWDQPTGTVSGQSTVGGGAHAIADPRFDPNGNKHFNNVYRVTRWDGPAPCVTAGGSRPTSGGLAIADPRVGYGANSHRNKLMVVDWQKPARTVTAGNQVQGGALSVADPRPGGSFEGGGKYKVTAFDAPTNTIIAGSTTGNGAFAVADPRCGERKWRAGPYGILPWNATAPSVTGSAGVDNGFHSVADPRLPGAAERLVCVIRALDNTWHRPFTTLELAALQGLIEPEEHLELYGLSDSAWRERIGNAVPAPAAAAIASVMGRALLLAWSGETFALDCEPIWVRPVAIAIAVSNAEAVA